MGLLSPRNRYSLAKHDTLRALLEAKRTSISDQLIVINKQHYNETEMAFHLRTDVQYHTTHIRSRVAFYEELASLTTQYTLEAKGHFVSDELIFITI